MQITWKVISWEEEAGDSGKGTGIMKHKLVGTEQTGIIKNSIGNGVAKELVGMSHGHELRGSIAGRTWGY